MKPTQIKNAFASIAEEAGKDEKLNQAIAGRFSAEKFELPLTELKALSLQFVVVILLAAAVYFAASLVQIEITGNFTDFDASAELEKRGFLPNQEIAFTPTLITLWLIRGITRGFILLAVLTFILTAAAMPVRRPEEKTGGSPCVA